MKTDGTIVLNDKRKSVIRALQEHGGKLEANGAGLITPAMQQKILGADHPYLLRMEADGILTRTINGRRTTKIALRKEYANMDVGKKMGRPKGSKNVSPNGGTPTTQRMKLMCPAPPVGSTVTVVGVVISPGGGMQMIVGDGQRTWQTTVERFAGG